MARSEKQLQHLLSQPVPQSAQQQPLIYYVTAPVAAKESSGNSAGWIFAASILVIIGAIAAGVLYAGPNTVLDRLIGTQPTAATAAQPVIPPAANQGGVPHVPQPQAPIVENVPAVDVALPAIESQPAQAEIVVTDSGAQIVPTAAPFDGASVLAQDKEPILAATPVPLGVYELAPDFAVLVLGNPTVNPTPASMSDWKK